MVLKDPGQSVPEKPVMRCPVTGATGPMPGTAAPEVESLGDRLKRETRELHDEAENHPIQRATVKGELPREHYVDVLEQMLIVHRALESQIRRHRERVPILANVIRDAHFQEPYLREDLAFFNRDVTAIRPLAATERLVQAINCVGDRCPVALIGFQYVLEGSNNGSIHIAKGVRRAYDLTGTDGTKYLDPYGSTQRENWQAFKKALNETPVTQAESDLILEAAKEMFRGITGMHEEMRQLISA